MNDTIYNFSEAVAQNSILQAIGIIVAVGTLVIFLYKNIPPFVIFALSVGRSGIGRAMRGLLRPAMRRARYDYVDIRLIVTSIVHYQFRIMSIFINAIAFAYLLIILIPDHNESTIFELRKIFTPDYLMIAVPIIALSAPLSIFATWAIFSPVLQLTFYAFSVRRYVWKQVHLNSDLEENRIT